MFQALDLPLILKHYDNGLVVVQSLNYSEERLLTRITDLIDTEAFPMTSIDLSQKLNMSITLATLLLTVLYNIQLIFRWQRNKNYYVEMTHLKA